MYTYHIAAIESQLQLQLSIIYMASKLTGELFIIYCNQSEIELKIIFHKNLFAIQT